METKTRSLLKAMTYRLLIAVLTFNFVYVAFNLYLAIFFTLGDFLLRFLAYYLHERFWSHITWG